MSSSNRVQSAHRPVVAGGRVVDDDAGGRVMDNDVVTDPHPPDSSDDRTGPASTRTASPRRTRWLFLVAGVILALDLVTKILAVSFVQPGNPIRIIGDTVTLRMVRNPGAAFSMATGMTWLLTLVAVAVVIGVIRIGRTLRSGWWAVGLGLVLGGALGNLIDRFFRAPGPLQGHVVDFVSVGWWPVFNVADSAIVCGAVLLVAITLFGIEPDGSRRSDDRSGAVSPEHTGHTEKKA